MILLVLFLVLCVAAALLYPPYEPPAFQRELLILACTTCVHGEVPMPPIPRRRRLRR